MISWQLRAPLGPGPYEACLARRAEPPPLVCPPGRDRVSSETAGLRFRPAVAGAPDSEIGF